MQTLKSMEHQNIALGFYQNAQTAAAVVRNLKQQGFRRFATIKHRRNGSLQVIRHYPIDYVLKAALVILVLLSVGAGIGWLSLPLATFCALGLILAVACAFRLFMIGQVFVNRFKDRVTVDEILVVVRVRSGAATKALAILRQVNMGHPVSFLLRCDVLKGDLQTVILPNEPLTHEQLRARAAEVAIPFGNTYVKKSREVPLLVQLNKSQRVLQFLRHDVSEAEHIEQTITLSAEWLLDNMYLIEGSIEDVRTNLPKAYYHELPKLAEGPLAGLPRVYAIAVEIVDATAGSLNRESIIDFLNSYQTVSPLTIGELWALPLMLRLRLIEWVQLLAVRVDKRMRDGELASFWGNRLLYMTRREPDRLPELFKALSVEQPHPSFHFAEELLEHLFDEEAILSHVRTWLEERLALPVAEVIHQEQIQETAEQLAFSNSVRSLITLSQLAWPEIFESTSPVDAVLTRDPAGIYAKMDFATRNRYREVVENLARYSHTSEVDIANRAIEMAKNATGDLERHVGYYLIDQGRYRLESEARYKPSVGQRVRRGMKAYPSLVYFGGIGLLTVGLEVWFVEYLWGQAVEPLLLLLLAFVALFPFSEISIQFITLLCTRVLRPAVLPKFSFKDGIPAEYRTLVVIPTMLSNPDSIRAEIDRLEIRYLANSDPFLLFGLFSDFTDAPQEVMEQDAVLIQTAVQGIEALDRKYGMGKFFLFHRQRVWSPCENAWIGWERKRGKLECLNSYLMGIPSAENIVYSGIADNLKGVRYVITLDSDTQLPKNQARALIEAIAHPLNCARLTEDGRGVSRGYTIIQPRVNTEFVHTKASWFSRIFSDPSAVDPYSRAVSNIYQDLNHDGTYYGKGIYDLAVFHSVLSQRFPDEHLLSHDLLEGAFVRVGFASDICLCDAHPEDYVSWATRQRRWMRGDFQISDWVLSKVPLKDALKEPNRLSLFSRWKIVDNIRRAFQPVFLMSLLLLGWLFTPVTIAASGLVTAVLFLPAISLVVSWILAFSVSNLRFAARDFGISCIRALVMIALLPQDAWLSIDAALRVAYRRLISRRHLLQWITPGYGNRVSQDMHRHFLLVMSWTSVLAAAVMTTLLFLNPGALLYATPFCVLWALSPVVVYLLDKPRLIRADKDLSPSDHHFLRRVARKTWRYFDDFVGPQTHWLPPDNFQAALRIEIAQRTSPTNIGLWLLAVTNAYDLRYVTLDEVLSKELATLEQLLKLERYEGHFLNWYDIATLDPLLPRYLSTVDSGNLIACMWTLEQTIKEIVALPLLPLDCLKGVRDTCDMVIEEVPGTHFKEQMDVLRELLSSTPVGLKELLVLVESSFKQAQEIQTLFASQSSEAVYWIKQVVDQLGEWESIINRYFSWMRVLATPPVEALAFKHAISEAMSINPSLQALAGEKLSAPLQKLVDLANRDGISAEIRDWSKRLAESISTSQWYAGEKIGQAQYILDTLKKLSDETNLSFLYNPSRKLFVVGYNVEEKRRDASFYDLLASEARLSSLIAIAKENVPLEHWWALGRAYSKVKGQRVLLSWGGSLFEYLMPLIFNKQYPDSLLGEACDAVVSCQMNYCRERGIPWGISEAAFSAIDAHKIYQYRGFGIPELGLKRGLEKDLVVSPYSSALALSVNAPAAVANLRHLAAKGSNSLWAPFGFYESIDYTRQRDPTGQRGVIVYAYMAHHQGMILSAVNNVLHDNLIAQRFHRDPRVRGVDSILYERIPVSIPVKIDAMHREEPRSHLQPFSVSPVMGVVDTPQSVTPKVCLLSNGKYAVMITNAGGGYSRWGDFDITRWRADTTRDSWGNYIYLKDIQSGACWSATHHPCRTIGENYSVSFKVDRAEFKRTDHGIQVDTEVVVSPEDDAEVWLLTLVNHSALARHLELTSYFELALAPHRADCAHPAFSKMFIETELAAPGLLAYRRLRALDDPPLCAMHVVATDDSEDGDVQYETDRACFIGRGHSLCQPQALGTALSNTAGTVLDPIFSLRKTVLLPPGKRVKVAFVTAVTNNRAATLSLIEKYKDLAACHRAIELAWSYAQLDLRHLRIHQEDVQLYQKLASRILYPHAQLRCPPERILNNRLGQSHLWAYGISGDLPIIVVSVGDMYDVDLVKQVLVAHAFWGLRGLKVDLVIINDEITGYEHPLQEQLERLTQAYLYRHLLDQPGGVYLRNSDKLPSEDLNLILASASAVLVAARGSLRQQLVSPLPPVAYPPVHKVAKRLVEEASQPLPFIELMYFNGLGGFSADGRVYAIYLGPNTQTPAPWINVIANPLFGTMVSEAGSGCTWYGNSQTNRLTPWANDALLDPITDAIYIRDDDFGRTWTPTPGPIRELDAYRVNHSQGYSRVEHNSHGIEQELTTFVPINDQGGVPLRIQRLRLFNNSPDKRNLTITSYSEWVLGTDKESTQMQVVTEWNAESQVLLAYNRYNADYGDRVAFCSSIPPPASYTGDRTEFLGRNSSTSSPDALNRRTLSGHVGATLDPCAALQYPLQLEHGEHKEIIFILGSAANVGEVRQLLLQCKQEGAVDKLLAETQRWWDGLLETVQVDVPDAATNHLLNRWLLYQTLSSRFWGRTGFYQSSGAFGFRDQLQDAMAFVYAMPSITREHLLKAASRQFVEGDVQHWWHPPSGGGIRTRISDDLLWLPFATAHYVRVTGDVSVLEENIAFLQAPMLAEGQHEAYQVPLISIESATLLEHCRRAIHKGMTAGPHGLPLIGGGDWNDGMNHVGIGGEGESVWLAWFLIHVMHDFAELLELSGHLEGGQGFRAQASRLAQTVEETSWDGDWYRRAYFDDGTPLGSKLSPEAIIDSLAQSWAVICGLGNPERCTTALRSAEEYLVKWKEQIVLLLTPPFDKSALNPGYIKGYPPGVRENGGQYTHGSLWLAMAYARQGDGDKAVALMQLMLPPTHALTPEAANVYKVEPYVAVGDVYDLPGQVGKGGWSWYTGAAGWMYRIWLEEILGFKIRGQKLLLQPTIPKSWDRFRIRYRYHTSEYDITVENPNHLSRGTLRITINDVAQESPEILLQDDGGRYLVHAILDNRTSDDEDRLRRQDNAG